MKFKYLFSLLSLFFVYAPLYGDEGPKILRVLVGAEEKEVWNATAPAQTPVQLAAGQRVTLEGTGFGTDPSADSSPDFSKVMVGTSRALERDLPFTPGKMSLADLAWRTLRHKNIYVETDRAQQIKDPVTGAVETWPQTWPKDVQSWTDTRIVFTVPYAATRGPIVVQRQKKTGFVPSQQDPSQDYLWRDPLKMRLADAKEKAPRIYKVATLGEPAQSNAVPAQVDNPEFAGAAKRGEAAFWSFDFNMGIFHRLAKLNWDGLLEAGKPGFEKVKPWIDPATGKAADPVSLFGAIKIEKGEVPEQVSAPVLHFDPFPMLMPLKSPLAAPLISGDSWPTDYVGYVRVDSQLGRHPKSWIGFSCAACHTRRITYQPAPGAAEVTRVFPGIPNPAWSVKFTLAGDVEPRDKDSQSKLGVSKLDKTQLIRAVPPGSAEMSLTRGIGDGSPYRNDGVFSPTAISIITRHTPVRRALSQIEQIEGFEGSYIHGEEPDGAAGPMHLQAQRDLTAYATTLDQNDELLGRIGMYRWLKHKNRLDEIDNASEGELVQKGFTAYPKLMTEIGRGQAVFKQQCLKCHQENFGTYTDENMRPFKEVGTFFGPTTFQQQTGAIRTAMIRDLYWVQSRGLLHDAHVRSTDAEHEDSIELLVDPDRCDETSSVYKALYTMHSDQPAIGGKPYELSGPSFRIPKGTKDQERATRNQAHFKDLPGNPDQYLYYDYQEVRSTFGIREFSSKVATPFEHAAPHSYCVTSQDEIEPLVHFLMTL